ncbi:gustatory receptor for sugar taste 64e-like [Toxorhynchites rutilus septentrionalis]|uniref:gustatory receptor for sugar taste 64e-like n=1 Tax=Toxorhynchites rutilus septentrionalis TaxID=329112 RepID=UPI002479A29C|nr:gustatory receptor for sugar taste 64e-like [Toxorhynchites rutilus septentrionalis]
MFGSIAKSDNLICVQPKPAWLEKEFHRQRKVNLERECSFLAVFRPVIIFGQVFGIFPVLGYGSARAREIEFKLFSLRTFYSLLVQLGGSILSGFSMATFWTTGVEFSKILSWIFFTINLLITLCFTLLAKQWAQLMTQWENTEQSLPRRTQLSAGNRKLLRKVKVFSSILMMSAMFEHALAKPSGLYRAYRCGIKELLKAHLMQAFPEMFSFIQYNIYVGFVAQVVTTILTFYWNFIDLFLIILSMGLRNNLKHVNDVILDSKAYYHSELFWHDHWKHYQRVCELVHLFKGKMAVFVIISFANNLFFICIQLVGFLKPYPGIIVAIYVWYSLAHLVTRMVLVSVYAAAIHDESRKLIPLFRTIPTKYYSKELQRFHEQVENDKVALSGFGFFHLTRKLLLKISATIVTYELVLLQLNDAEEKNGDQNPCT